MLRRFLTALAVIVVVLASGTTSAWAHNSLVGSTPGDGATVQAAPTQISLLFAGSVPLDTFSAELIDPSGSRTSMSSFAHGFP